MFRSRAWRNKRRNMNSKELAKLLCRKTAFDNWKLRRARTRPSFFLELAQIAVTYPHTGHSTHATVDTSRSKQFEMSSLATMTTTRHPRNVATTATSRPGRTHSKQSKTQLSSTHRHRQHLPRVPISVLPWSSSSSSKTTAAFSAEELSADAAPAASDVRVRVLRGEEEIPPIVRLCAAVFKEVAGKEEFGGVGLREGDRRVMEHLCSSLPSHGIVP